MGARRSSLVHMLPDETRRRCAAPRRCRLRRECAYVCRETGGMPWRQTAFDPATARAALQACAQICKVCGDECEHHAQRGFAHCQTCMEACRRCEQACNALLTLVASLPA